MKLTGISKVFSASTVRDCLMMEAVSSSVTSVNLYETTQYNIPQDLHTCCHENLKSYVFTVCDINPHFSPHLVIAGKNP
jgi:hypothetical protein